MAGENINRKLNIFINDREVVNSLGGISKEITKTKLALRNLNAGAEDYDDQVVKLKKHLADLTVEQAKFKKEIAETPSILQKIKGTLGPVASGMIAAFSVGALVGGFVSKMREAWSIVVDFDQKQADLAAIMQKSRIQIAGLTADAIKYGASTSYSAGEVSVLQTELARLGKTAPEIRAMTKDVLSAATALETDLGSAATLVGGQLNSYGENANKAGKYSDIMANSVNISATSFEYLQSALPKVSAVAALNNVAFERLNATMGTLADQNIQAETAGTGFRNILLESAKAGKPYQEMLDQVKNSANQGKTAVDLFGKENATVAVILANSTDKINEQTKALENSAGSAEKLAKEKMNSILGSTKNFSSAWEGLLLSIEKGDGVFGRGVKNVIDFGSSFLSLLTPMKKVSDQLEEEQLGLNMLVSKITSTNLKNEDRKALLIQLKNEYPDFIKSINLEKVSNNELNTSLNKINEQYVNRIALQKQVEKIEGKQKDAGYDVSRKLEQQEKLFSLLNKMKGEKGLKTNIDYGNLKKSGTAVIEELTKRGGSWQGAFSDVASIKSYIKTIEMFDTVLKKQNKEINEETDVLNRQQKSLGISTEAQNEANKAKSVELELMKATRDEAKSLGMKKADTATDSQVKVWLAAYKEKQMYRHEDTQSDISAKAKVKADAKKHSEELEKDLKSTNDKFLALQRTFEDAKLANLKDGFDKEKQIIEVDAKRKVEDTTKNVSDIQAEIDKLKTDAKNPKNSKEDNNVLNSEIAAKIAIQKEYTSNLVTIEKTKNLKLGALQEKYLEKSFQKEQKNHARKLLLLKTDQDNQLAGITTLEQAKEILSATMSEKELRGVTTLEEAKKIIKANNLKEQLKLEIENLDKIVAAYKAALSEDSPGFKFISDEERDKLNAALDEANAKIATLKLTMSGGTDPAAKEDNGGDIDILGFTKDQWVESFKNIDDLQSALSAVSMVAQSLTSAFSSYFKFLEAGEARTLQKFQRSADGKKRALADQLEKGTISQEVYNAKMAKIDADLAKKKAEIEYKQAKRQKAMAITNAIIGTAVAVINALSTQPVWLGIAMGALIGTMGALEVASIAKQPLPDKSGFYDGGYTGDGNPRSESTALGVKPYTYHKKEYVVPEKVLFSNDPVVPNIVGYLEAKRTGKQPLNSQDETASSASSQGSSGSAVIDAQVVNALNRNSAILEKIEDEGIQSYLVNDYQTAKKMRDKIKEVTKNETNAKP